MVRNIFIVLFLVVCASAFSQDLKLWYKQPARTWNEALPIGNGRLGAMVFGGVQEELLQLNEETLWSGGPTNTNPNPFAPQLLPEIREALFAGNYKLAEELTTKLQGLYTESYEPLGDVRIRLNLPEGSSPENYKRDLDIASAVATTSFKVNNVTYTREMFASYPDQVIAIRLTSSVKNMLQFSVNAVSQLYYQTQPQGNDGLLLSGKAPSHTDPSYQQSGELPVVYNDPTGCRGMRFALQIKAITTDGKVSTDDNGLHVNGATEVTLLISAATSFNGFDKCPDKDGKDEKALAGNYLTNASAKDYASLKKAHVTDYKKYFDRVSLSLPGKIPDVPTDKRMRLYAEGAMDHGLEVLYFQYGRYLLISSSRPGGVAANLQGIWNHHVRPPWSSNFTTNINTEMNYWMAETCNLPEFHEPLLKLIRNVAATGKETARNFYNASGWTMHHNTDIWATTNPVSGSPMWANWPMGGAWFSQHLWEHYQFNGDLKYLNDFAYPLMKDAARFCMDWLIENPDGLLVTAPSTSPENVFITEDGYKGTVSIATTMDMSLIWDLFINTIQASQHLDIDPAFRDSLFAKLDKLYPLKIGKKGNLQEWYLDWEDEDPEHRHISHLFGIFPGRQISPLHTPDLAKAVRRSMELRGDGGTGWSKGWKINVWARLLDGNRAYKLIREQLKLTGVEGTNYANGGGTYPNLLDAHPPFQIDGNFGGSSGITEMLLQSHDGVVHLLPALPDAWNNGKVTGLRARGGYTIDITWKNKKITDVKIHSSLGNKIRLASKTTLTGKSVTGATGKNRNPHYQSVHPSMEGEIQMNGIKLFDLQTEPGKVYLLKGK